MASLEDRVIELEEDVPESESRLMELIAEIKSDVRRVSETQELHVQVMKRMLSGKPIYDPEKELLTKKLKRALPCEHCS